MGGDSGPYSDYIEEPDWLWDEPGRLSRPLKPPPPLAWYYGVDPMWLLLLLALGFQIPAVVSWLLRATY